jgi:hypothetical protein
MRMVGNWFSRSGRVDCSLLEAIGHAGVAAWGGLALAGMAKAASPARMCSPSDELETNRLDGVSGWAESLAQAGLSWATLEPEPGPGATVESAASLDCSCCQTATVESWYAIANPPRMPAITTWLFLSENMMVVLSAIGYHKYRNEKTFADFASEGLFRFGIKDLWWIRPIPS